MFRNEFIWILKQFYISEIINDILKYTQFIMKIYFLGQSKLILNQSFIFEIKLNLTDFRNIIS